MNRVILRYALLFVFSLTLALLASGEQVVTGPPPEVKGHIDAFVNALNSGRPELWEQMAQEHFSPGALKRHSVEKRRQVFDDLRRDFETISVGMVEGPDEPLQVHVKGSTGETGVVELKLEPDAGYWHFLEASVIWELLERNAVRSLP
jgi:hypothetical protein